MRKVKSRILIGDRYLGNLFYDSDKSGNQYLKLTFIDNIGGLIKGTNTHTYLPVPARLASPVRLEITYKFTHKDLMIKTIYGGLTRDSYEYYPAPLPAIGILFYLKIKDWTSLRVSGATPSPLVLTPPNNEKQIALIFSFPDKNGIPFCVDPYLGTPMGEITLPRSDNNKFYIGLAPDPTNTSTEGITIVFPSPPSSSVS